MTTALRAVTFDFWSTLVDGTITPERTAQRLARLHKAIVGAGCACTPEQLQQAFRRALDHVAEQARETLEDVGPPGRWAELARQLDIPEGLIPYEVVERTYDDITFDPLPAPMPNIFEALEATHKAGYRMGIICNTGMVGGRTLRNVLERHGMLHYFEATVFSNEFGFAKPHPRIFEHTLQLLGGVPAGEALHVGDLEELDVEGARRAGMHAALYAPDSSERATSDADFVVTDWRHFGAQLAAFDESLAAESAAAS